MEWYLLKEAGFPVAQTFISFDYDETLQWISTAHYPLVTKIRTASSSDGVHLIRPQARLLVERVFRTGLPTYWPFARQKNYVFFQEFIPGAEFDIRVTVVDRDNIFGYYRAVAKNDFRASGLGALRWGPLLEAVKLAVAVKEKLDMTNLSVDILYSRVDRKCNIIETSQFIKADTPGELKIEDRWGRYRYDEIDESLVFEPGETWLQELCLRNFFESRFPGS